MTRHKAIVLVVDDDNDIRTTLGEVLEREGYLVLEARDGEEALCRARGITGRVVAIVDLMMPGMDGHELIGRMRADEALSSMPIVVITAHGRGEVAGADVVMMKPLSPNRLLETIAQYCQ